MESSKFVASVEECRTGGSESGWTSYLVSRGQESSNIDDKVDVSSEDGHNRDEQRCYRKGYATAAAAADGSESDDSMASDASSGPSHCETSYGSNEKFLGMGHLRCATNKYPTTEKPHRQVKQRNGANIRVGKEESIFKAKTAASHVPSSTKESEAKRTS